MTLTTPARARPTSSFRWVPAAAGWIVGIIATLSLLASVSPLVRSRDQGSARVRQRLHLQLPRHQLRVGVRAGAAGRRAGGAQTHRAGGSWSATWSRRSAGTSRDLAEGDETVVPGSRRDHRPRLPPRGDRVPGAGPQGVLGQGAPRRAAQGGRRAGRAAMARRHADRVGAAGALPRHAGPPRPVLVRAEPGQRVRRCRRRLVQRSSARVRQRAARPVRRAGPDGRRDRAVPVAARRQRAHRRGRIGDPRPARALRQERLAGLLRHPPRQVRGVRPERPRRHHLPRRGRRLPGQRRPGRRSEGLAAGHRGVAGAVPDLRLGARRDGRQLDWPHRPSARPASTRCNSATRRSCTPTISGCPGPTCVRCVRP